MDVQTERIAGNTWARKAAEKRSTVNVRTILSVATAAAGLVSAGLAANYDHLIRQGYRWVSVDGPLACVSKDDLRQMIGKPSDELTLKMVEEVRAYYLIRGSMVRVVAQETSSGLSQINIPGITQNLWTLTKFLTKQPIRDIIGRIETPGMLGGATPRLPQAPRLLKARHLRKARRLHPASRTSRGQPHSSCGMVTSGCLTA